MIGLPKYETATPRNFSGWLVLCKQFEPQIDRAMERERTKKHVGPRSENKYLKLREIPQHIEIPHPEHFEKVYEDEGNHLAGNLNRIISHTTDGNGDLPLLVEKAEDASTRKGAVATQDCLGTSSADTSTNQQPINININGTKKSDS